MLDLNRQARAFLLAALVLWTSGFVASLRAESTDDGGFDAGFFASRYRDVNGDWRLKVLGPLYERAQSEAGHELDAVRPFYSQVEDPVLDRTIHDYLWPLGNNRTTVDENYWRFLVFYGFNHTTNDTGDRYRTWLIPFYFQGRDASGDTYRALFPVGGTIKDFVGRDQISFALFPLYSYSTLNDLETHNVLWPLISRTTSERGHIYRHRFFPFYAVNHHEGKFHKRAILWPFYTDVTYDYKHSKGSGHILFPLYGRLKLNTENTWWVLPPFFRYTKGQDGRVIFAPWPFYQRRVTEEVDLRYVWPLWGRKTIGDLDRTFYLWPIVWTIRDQRPDTDWRRFYLVPFYYNTTVFAAGPAQEGVANPPVVARRNKLWPLYTYRRDGEASMLRVPDLWPFGHAASVERNWSPLWSLYTRERNGDRIDHEVLWGLYRNQRRGDEQRYVSLFPVFDYRRDASVDRPAKSWNILKGLIGYERASGRKSIRLLYLIRFGIGKDAEP
ncbi:MAG TPA: hypothetical protein PKC67_12390 [Kiritimatiellia bacterium]|nr:hypothetical protein [Kiritimatiellia bacterium]HMP35138.1 hypothetical protein [Kiritimatiellia bacterium]